MEIGKRCPNCRFRVRGPNHLAGDHHAGHAGKIKFVAGPVKERVRTRPAKDHLGYDFSTIKGGGVRLATRRIP